MGAPQQGRGGMSGTENHKTTSIQRKSQAKSPFRTKQQSNSHSSSFFAPKLRNVTNPTQPYCVQSTPRVGRQKKGHPRCFPLRIDDARPRERGQHGTDSSTWYFYHLPHTSLVLSDASRRRRWSCVSNSPASLTTEELPLRRNASHSVSRPWIPKKSCTTR